MFTLRVLSFVREEEIIVLLLCLLSEMCYLYWYSTSFSLLLFCPFFLVRYVLPMCFLPLFLSSSSSFSSGRRNINPFVIVLFFLFLFRAANHFSFSLFLRSVLSVCFPLVFLSFPAQDTKILTSFSFFLHRMNMGVWMAWLPNSCK